MILKEVVCALYYSQTLWSWELFKPLDSKIEGSKFVCCPMNEQLWLRAALEDLFMEPPSGDTDANHCLDAVVVSSDAQSHIGTE